MPAPRSELERRVERNTNDVISIYELLTDQGLKVTAIEDRVTAIESKVDTIESKVDTIESKVDTIESKVDTIESKVDTISETLTEHGGQLAEILKRLPPTA